MLVHVDESFYVGLFGFEQAMCGKKLFKFAVTSGSGCTTSENCFESLKKIITDLLLFSNCATCFSCGAVVKSFYQ